MTAKIIPFAPPLNRKRESTRSPSIAFHSVTRGDDLMMDHADTAPCEYVFAQDVPGHDFGHE